jgi:Tfp pilus assembly protein FimV
MSRPRRKPRPGPARYAAPAAFLLAITIAVLLIRAGLGDGDTATTATTGPSRPAATRVTTTQRQRTDATRFYTVVSGDTFGSISAKTGVPVATIEELNPGVDSNSLQVGQRLRVK